MCYNTFSGTQHKCSLECISPYWSMANEPKACFNCYCLVAAIKTIKTLVLKAAVKSEMPFLRAKSPQKL